jgi:hypothetical protein
LTKDVATIRLAIWVGLVGLIAPVSAGGGDKSADDHGGSDSRFSDEPVPLAIDLMPERPKPLLELGAPFLGTGNLHPGFELPTGAVWQPSVLVFGTYRTAIQAFDNRDETVSEWAHRLDLFLEFRFSGTERLLFGFRPLDDDGRFTSFNFHPRENNDWQTEFNGEVNTLFFEGDFGEIFPNLDPEDRHLLDIGFAVGRQPIFIQEGMMINDFLDGVGFVRNTLLPFGTSNYRMTTFYAWNDVHRGNNFQGNNVEDETAQLWGLFTEADTPTSTINLDFAYVSSRHTGEAFYAGLSAVQRIGQINTAFRANASFPVTGESEQNTRGYLFFGEVSWTPHHTDDIMYVNGFYGLDQYSSAARDPTAGGPLGRTGILYAAVGLGRYGSALSNQADDAYGVSVGYQKIFDIRRQLIVEVGGRKDTDNSNRGQAAIGARYQQAFGQHMIMQFDTFAAATEGDESSFGARLEFLFKF